MKKDKQIGRITYVEDWHGEGEHFVFEWKFESEESWNFECAAKLFNFGEYKDMIHYTALTKIREWAKIGITEIYWR